MGVVSVLVMTVSVPELITGVRTAVYSEEVEGLAVDTRSTNSGRWATVTYSVSGDEYTEEMFVSDVVRPGDTVVVLHQPDNPEIAVATIGWTLWLGGATTALALIPLLIGLRAARNAIRGENPSR
jgi:hypothetical protein